MTIEVSKRQFGLAKFKTTPIEKFTHPSFGGHNKGRVFVGSTEDVYILRRNRARVTTIWYKKDAINQNRDYISREAGNLLGRIIGKKIIYTYRPDAPASNQGK